MSKIACVAVVRNEARFIAEFVAWQFIIGFDTVVLLDNGSTDGTVAAAQAVRGDVRIIDWPMAAADYQMRGYEHACAVLAGAFDWLAFFDADEFLVLPEGVSLQTVLARCADADAVGVPWAVFGSSGRVEATSGLVIETFTRRGEESFAPNRHIKSIVRPGRVLGALNPHGFHVAGRYAGLDGRTLNFSGPGILADRPDFSFGKLHHYFGKSREDWQQKLRRGYHDIVRSDADFLTHDVNGVMDDSAARLAAVVRARLSPDDVGRCAVVLMVKDEATDILAWLAWYLELGFDACIVYDDDSSDGTWDILQQAALVQDVRPLRTVGPKPGRYEVRQEMCYRQALSKWRDEFEWLAFFDADEFLLLNEDDNIQSFLRRFGEADAVAVNWCNYGSGGHVLKPALPAFEAYTWHGDERQPINRHVKSILRPRKTGPGWRNVHCFDVPDERYVLANGANVVWSKTEGIIAGEPDWRVAKLMHYQCRSMEHFIERMKKRPELAAIPDIWRAQDVRQVQDERPARHGPAVRARMAKLQSPAQPANIAHAVQKIVFDIGMSEGNDTAFYLAKGFRVVGVEADVKMFIELNDRFEAAISAGMLTLYNRAAGEQAGQIVEFFHHDRYQGLSGLSHARAEFADGAFTSYHVLTTDWRDLIDRHGVPHYLKLDIEGNEPAFLRGMKGAAVLPPFVSIECHDFAPVEMLQALGYRRFQLVDQNPAGGFCLPAVQREGRAISWETWTHATGPFGSDLPDDGWVDFAEFRRRWQAARPDCARTWFDCHARLE
jgi:FkbM family methyltransferase